MTSGFLQNDRNSFSAISSSALQTSGNWSVGEPESVLESDFVDTFDLIYHGSLNIDRRYAPSVFQWLAKKVIRLGKVKEEVTAHISKTVLQITERFDQSVITQEHSFDSIYRLSRLRHCGLDNYFAYIIHDKPEISVCAFHIFECGNTDLVSIFYSRN